MLRFFERIDRWMLRHCPRYRLWRICNAIGIKPYKWQKRFALGEFDYLPPGLKDERASGKNLAVFLRILMIPKNNADAWMEAGRIITMDTAYNPNWSPTVLRIYSGEYRRLRDFCLDEGIPVLRVEIYRMMQEYNRRK